MYAAGLGSLEWRRAAGDEASFSASDLAKNSRKAFLCSVEMMEYFQRHSAASNQAAARRAKMGVRNSSTILVRVGCASGAALGGILSRYKFAFDLYGSSVDEAEFLSSQGGSHLQLSICESTLLYARETVHSYISSSPQGVVSKECSTKMPRGNSPEVNFLALCYN